MTCTLVAKLPSDLASPVSWAIFDDESNAIADQGELIAGQKFSSGRSVEPSRVWVLVPGSVVTARSVDVPALGDVRTRDVVSFVLEDDLAENQGDIHFAFGKRRKGQRLVCCVAKEQMSAWKVRLSELGMQPDVIIPDFLALSAQDSEVSIVEHDGDVLVRHPDGGFAIESKTFIALSEDLLASTDAHSIWSDNLTQALPPSIVESERTVVSPALTSKGFFELAYKSLTSGIAFNLLQFEHARRRAWARPGRHWRRAVALAGATIALTIAAQVADGIRFNRDAEMAYRKADAVFHEVMPEGTRLVNARAQLSAHAASLDASTSNQFLKLSGFLYAGVSATDGVIIDSLRFDSARNEVTASLSLPSFESIEKIRRAVISSGVTFVEGGARQQGERILADIVVRTP